MMGRNLFVSSLLLFSLSLNAQTPAMFWASEPRSYGTEMDAVIAVAKTKNVPLPTEYTLRCLQRLIADLKVANKWDEIKVLHCFEHDGGLAFSKINLKSPATFDTLGLYATANSYTAGGGGNSYFDFKRNTGIRNFPSNFGYFWINHVAVRDETIGVTMETGTNSNASGPIIGTYSYFPILNISQQRRGTIIFKEQNGTVFRGLKNSAFSTNYVSTTSLGGTYSDCRAISVSRDNTSISIALDGNVNSLTNTVESNFDDQYLLMGNVANDAGNGDTFTYDTYSWAPYIKFLWIGTNQTTANQMITYFNNYSSWIPN